MYQKFSRLVKPSSGSEEEGWRCSQSLGAGPCFYASGSLSPNLVMAGNGSRKREDGNAGRSQGQKSALWSSHCVKRSLTALVPQTHGFDKRIGVTFWCRINCACNQIFINMQYAFLILFFLFVWHPVRRLPFLHPQVRASVSSCTTFFRTLFLHDSSFSFHTLPHKCVTSNVT